MSDLVERLRGNGAVPVTIMTKTLCREAADEIERLTVYYELHKFNKKTIEQLQARVEALEGVLDRLARLGNEPHYGNSDGNVIAQKALAATEPEGET